MMAKFNTSCPSGFPEWTPAQERVAQKWIATIRDVFEKNGFMPITTPLVEREENLLSKGGNPKEMYVLKRILDEEGDSSHSGNALRFDHTVPLALYVARHFNELSFPFRRYAIGPVLRGERAQKGRFRQFDQCDIDVVGSENLSLKNDAMVAAVIIQIFERLMPEQKFIVRINNRKILTGIANFLNISSQKFLEIWDHREKVTGEEFNKKLNELVPSGKKEKFREICDFAITQKKNPNVWHSSDWENWFDVHKTFGMLNKESAEGAEELITVCRILRNDLGISPKQFEPDFSIARGLDYYTGTVYETHLVGYESLGSICSGGRYDDLAEVFTGKKLPGVGISIGLTRLLSQLFEAKLIDVDRSSPSEILIVSASEKAEKECLALSSQIRSWGYPVENYLEDKKLAKQFDYANKLGIPYVIVVGEDELNKKCVQLKNMKIGDQEEISRDTLQAVLEKKL
ncbi:histidine--tRNA ligase [Candidatus Gracilibacteria bacterium]|nr:histidine--tRNA ligase [Candidatus Gracilibacteria bacterium]MCF7819261.1 histidine--tRNA ligase [Candidatus Gracilibacteria bacterium]